MIIRQGDSIGAMDVNIEYISDAEDPRMDGAIQCLVLANPNDALGGPRVSSTSRACAFLSACVVGGRLAVAVDRETGQVVGTASWFPPGQDILDSEEQRSHPAVVAFFDEAKEHAPEMYTWLHDTLLPLTEKNYDSVLGAGFRRANWSLYCFAVHPAFQGRGIGRKLLEDGHERARKTGSSVCFGTETEENVAMYRHLGYEVKGRTHMPPPEGDNARGYESFVMSQSFAADRS